MCFWNFNYNSWASRYDINIIWETWKTNINKAATNAIGMKKKVKNHKHFWDKEHF
jgi:hypothetical protein